MDLEILEKIEELFCLKGCIRVLYILYKYKEKSFRFYTLHKMTLLPFATLDRVLNFLISKNLVEKGKEFFTFPRKETVNVYKISSFGKSIAELVLNPLVEDLIEIKENAKKFIQLLKEKNKKNGGGINE